MHTRFRPIVVALVLWRGILHAEMIPAHQENASSPAPDLLRDMQKIDATSGLKTVAYSVRFTTEEGELNFFQGETDPAKRAFAVQMLMVKQTLERSTDEQFVVVFMSVFSLSGTCYGYCAPIPDEFPQLPSGECVVP